MSKRVTIMVEDDIDTFLRQYQANMIRKTESSFSYSKAVNEKLRSIVGS